MVWRIAVITCGATFASAWQASNRHGIPLTELPMSMALQPFSEAIDSLTGKPVRRALTHSQAVTVVNTFAASDFKAADGWFGLEKNNHWQTIVGTGALTKVVTGKEQERSFSVLRERFDTPDGDFFDVEFTAEHFSPGTDDAHAMTPIVIILHGLESNSGGSAVTKMCEAYIEQGFSCALFNFRGCSGEENKRPGAYHVGFTADADQLAAELMRRYPNRKIYLSGFSLGGNVSLKLLGELGDKAATERNIHGAVTMSVPYDAVGSGASIDNGVNKYIYSANFLRTLKKKAERQHKEYPDAFDINRIRACQTVGDFDDAFIAAIYGFRDKIDYYEQNGSIRWLSRVRVPAISISARDDPFIPGHILPHPERDVRGAPVRLVYHDNGGHCGFVHKGQDGRSSSGGGKNDRWIAQEMARALRHIHQETERLHQQQ